ncbi:hypothetical protein EIN_349690 [Entamoeba invadens IP1]|uniref:Porin domain-containing protein n=1 Tax=Entamoeba invadens IP1 TaxID=370355 RepID=A0A0A1U5R2_ENTIV|nr:hypothetical protein EIN_349690 [Entamoeba invadens IP1]ELP89659.1 hypothetical protein EIN_349690 [Entamoeba invadens IP1]|eukprot:XP_004256430.1 hypothetical protein EIN_349690 [Entamoeba invadens IP1]
MPTHRNYTSDKFSGSAKYTKSKTGSTKTTSGSINGKYKFNDKFSVNGNAQKTNTNGQRSSSFGVGADYTSKKLTASTSYTQNKSPNSKTKNLKYSATYKPTDNLKLSTDGSFTKQNGQKSRDLSASADYTSKKLDANVKVSSSKSVQTKSKSIAGGVAYRPTDKVTIGANGKYSKTNGVASKEVNVKGSYTGDKLSVNGALSSGKNGNDKTKSLSVDGKYKVNDKLTVSGGAKRKNTNGNKSSEGNLKAEYIGKKVQATLDLQQTQTGKSKSGSVDFQGKYQPNEKSEIHTNFKTSKRDGKRQNEFGIGGRNAKVGGGDRSVEIAAGYNPNDKFGIEGNAKFGKENGKKINSYGVKANYKPNDKWDLNAEINKANGGKVRYTVGADYKINDRAKVGMRVGRDEGRGNFVGIGGSISF